MTDVIEAATHIDVEAEVRYWEDASVNGVEDEDGSLIFGKDGEEWKVRINLSDGIIEGWPHGTEANIHYKVCDAGEYWLSDDYGKRVAKWKDHYVPGDYLCHGDNGYGDYIIMSIDSDGSIIDYERPDFDPDQWTPTS